MTKKTYQFSKKQTTFYFNASFSHLGRLTNRAEAILVTDENVFRKQKKLFAGWKTIVLKAGEAFKNQPAVDALILQLIGHGANRQSMLVGVGGGVVTDITGYAASIYMRGIRFGFVPTTILAMVDASIGGKNGVDVGIYKNLAGTINQPDFLLYDSSFLKSLPRREWISGFAEVIKHACILDKAMFNQLEKHQLSDFMKDSALVTALVRRNALLKAEVVKLDEFEKNERRLLNFGHTLGHAIENLLGIAHGEAVAIGMIAACRLSEELTGFSATEKVISLLKHYKLPTLARYDASAAFEILQMDKKSESDGMNYVLLNKIGAGLVKKVPVKNLETLLHQLQLS